jgi:cytochrome c553
MKSRSKKAFAAAGATLAVAASAGGALAAGGRGHHGPARLPGPAKIASYLGLTPAQLRQQLRGGKTLAQIAVAQGKTVAGLEDAIYADVQAHLDQAVTNGKITAAQEQAILTRLKAHLDDIVNHAFPLAGARGAHRPALVAAVATYLGVTPTELRTELRVGKSLAQIATAHGKTVAGLKSAILAAVKAKLDKAVASGRLTGAQEQALLDRVSAHLDRLVNRTGKPRP